MATGKRFSDLSATQQVLVRMMQGMNVGQILDLHVKNGEPTLTPRPATLIDIRLDTDEPSRPELQLPDFELPSEVRRFFARLHEIEEGKITRVEVRAGLPRRLVWDCPITEMPR